LFFFLQEIAEIQQNWDKYLESIPLTIQQKEDQALYKAAGSNRLEKFKYFNLVDGLVKTYPQYSHYDIECLPYQVVMNLVSFNKESGYLTGKYNDIKNKHD
jgi:hypothetical protein